MKTMIKTIIILTLTVMISVTSTLAMELSDKEIDNIVRRSYQYVAMYNVINKQVLMEDFPFRIDWNGTMAVPMLADHTVKIIARPNNDTLYVVNILDLRTEPVIVHYPAFDSKFVCLETSAYDHYCDIPLTTTKGDFGAPMNVLFFSKRTKNYSGKPVKGVDKIIELSGDFATAFLRIMPHAAEPERFKKNIETMKQVHAKTLSEFQGMPKKAVEKIDFPAFSTDAGVFENNFLEVMQFVFNHTTFDLKDEMDQKVLGALKPLGVEPGKMYNKTGVKKIDGKKFGVAARRIHQESFAIWTSPEGNPYVYDVFKPKGEMTLEAMVLQSAFGPVGLPAHQAIYPGLATKDGKPFNALNNYVIRMKEDQLPPAKAFWSVTLYDAENGFFIPNDRKKYSVGENAGFKLNQEGGIDIHIAAKKPVSVPEENWLPINRKDLQLDIVMRIYAPNLEKMKAYKLPTAELVK